MANRERVVVALVLLFAGLALSGCTVQAPPELFTAIRQGDLDYTKTTLENNPEFANSKDESGYTPLILAAGMGNKDLCEVLIASGANLEAKGEHGTALHEAAIGNHKDIVELLIDKGANVNAKDNSGNTPLYYASTFGQGRKRNKNDWDIAGSLASNGANINMKPVSNDTPLHSAALYAPKEIVRLFLDNGADVNIKLISFGWPHKPNNGFTPLHNACMRADKDVEILELLIAGRAHINAKCYSEHADGWTPLYFACLHENTKAVELLIAKGAKINPISDLGNTPIHYATNAEIAELLIDNGANIYFRNKEGFSPLHNAVKGGHSDVAKLLIANRAYVTVTNHQGTSLLHEAAITKQKEMVELLLTEGVNVNAKDRAGNTALHLTAQGDREMVLFLLSKGADIDVINKDGMTPAQQAETSGQDDIADLIRNYNAK